METSVISLTQTLSVLYPFIFSMIWAIKVNKIPWKLPNNKGKLHSKTLSQTSRARQSVCQAEADWMIRPVLTLYLTNGTASLTHCGLCHHFLPAVYSHSFLQHPTARPLIISRQQCCQQQAQHAHDRTCALHAGLCLRLSYDDFEWWRWGKTSHRDNAVNSTQHNQIYRLRRRATFT